jgi:hypothetical protein
MVFPLLRTCYIGKIAGNLKIIAKENVEINRKTIDIIEKKNHKVSSAYKNSEPNDTTCSD